MEWNTMAKKAKTAARTDIDVSSLPKHADAVGHMLAENLQFVELVDETIEAKVQTTRGPAQIAVTLMAMNEDGKIDLSAWPTPGSSLTGSNALPLGTNEIPDKYTVREGNRDVSHSWYEDTFLTFSPKYRALKARIDLLTKVTNRKRDNSDLPKEVRQLPYPDAVNERKAAVNRLNYGVESLFRRAVRLIRQIEAIEEHCPNVSVSFAQNADGTVLDSGTLIIEAPKEATEVKTVGEVLAWRPEIAAANGGTLAALKTSNAREDADTPTVGERVKTFDHFRDNILDLAGYADAMQEDDTLRSTFRAAFARWAGTAGRKKETSDETIKMLGDFFAWYRDEVFANIQARYVKLVRDAGDAAEQEAEQPAQVMRA